MDRYIKSYITKSIAILFFVIFLQIAFTNNVHAANRATSANGASATGIDNYSGTPADAIDVNDSTAWMSTTLTNASPWLKVNLGSARTITGFRLLEPSNECHRMTQYKIESSTDDSNWTNRYTSPTNLTGGDTGLVSLTSASAQYWKITGLGSAGNCGTQIYTFELHDSSSFPAVSSVTNNGSNSSQTSLSVSVPAVTAGDRLVAAFFTSGGGGGGSAPSGWTRIYDDNQYVSVYEKIASGSESSGSVTFTQDTSGGWATQVYLITGSHPSSASQVSSIVSGSNTSSVDPGTFTPTGGAKDWLWIAYDLHGHLFGTTRTISTYPTDYTSTTPSNQTGGISQQLAGSAYRQLNASSENPGAFTLSGAIQTSRAFTIVVPPPDAPTITTPTNTSITSSGATLGGNVTSNGGSSITGRGVCVGTSSNPALGGTCFSTTGTTGVFTVSATGLNADTLYHYRAYATNAVGTSYTTDDTFTTASNAPNSVTADAETNVGSFKVTLNGSANPNSLATTMHFRVLTSDPGTCATNDTGGTRVPLLSGNDIALTTNAVTQQKSITTGYGNPSWLTPSTNYWYCTYATNSAGTTTSTTPQAFTTTSGQVSPCDPATSGNLTISESCSFDDDNDGVDLGAGTSNTASLTLSTGASLTLNSGQKIGRGSIALSGGTLILASGGSLIRGGVWVKDADADGVVDDGTRAVSATSPGAGFVRRNGFSSTYPYYSLLRAVNTFDCNSANANIYQTITSLVTDSDNDGYKTSAAASDQCVGATSVINTRTYYKDSAGAYTRLASAAVLGGGSTDCADTGLCSDGVSASSTCWTSDTYYPDSDADTKGVASNISSATFPQTAATDNSVGSVSWTNATNVGASDNIYATASIGAGSLSRYLKATNFGFNVSGTINGVIVEVESKASATSSIGDYSVKLVKGGSIVGEERADVGSSRLTGSDTNKVYGRANDLWGTTLTSSDVNASGFGVVVSYKNTSGSSRTASIDGIKITIYSGDGSSSVCGAGSPPAGYASNTTDCNDADSNSTNSTTSSGYTGADADGDGYLASATSYTYCGAANSRGTQSTADCYDSNSNAKPGQTAYFSTNRGDGSFDYDCVGGSSYTRDSTVVNDQSSYTSATNGTTTGSCQGWYYKDYSASCTAYSNQSLTNCWGGDTYVGSVTGDVTTSTTCGSTVVRTLYSSSNCSQALSPVKYRFSDSVGTTELLGCR